MQQSHGLVAIAKLLVSVAVTSILEKCPILQCLGFKKIPGSEFGGG